MTSLDTIVGMFYGNTQKTLHLFVYMCVPSLIELVKTCHYFHNHKKYLYNLIVVRLSTLQGFNHKYFCSPTIKLNLTEKLCEYIIQNVKNNKSIQGKSKKYLIATYTNLRKKIKHGYW